MNGSGRAVATGEMCGPQNRHGWETRLVTVVYGIEVIGRNNCMGSGGTWTNPYFS